MTTPATIRRNLAEHVTMLAEREAQLRYERDVPHVPVYVELIESFFDSYYPGEASFEKAFSPGEKECLADLRRLLESCSLTYVHSVSDLLAQDCWQAVMQQARKTQQVFEANTDDST